MATADSNTPIVDEEKKARTAIELDLALKSFVEAHKQAGSSKTAVIVVGGGAFLVTVLVDPRGLVAIPALGLTLGKIHAAEVLLVLTCAALYNWAGMILYTKLLRIKARHLCLEVGYDTFPWYAAQATPSSFQMTFFFVSRFVRVASLAAGASSALIFFSLPVYLMIKIGAAAAYASHWIFSSALSCVFLVAALIIFSAAPSDLESEKIVKRIDTVFDLRRARKGRSEMDAKQEE